MSGHDGDLDVHSELTVTGTVTGSIAVHRDGVLGLVGVAQGGVVVTGGGFARISGTTNGMFVAVGGQATLTGTCQGSATNDGGQLDFEGTVTGERHRSGWHHHHRAERRDPPAMTAARAGTIWVTCVLR